MDIIVTLIGKDRMGIIAELCTYLANNGMNIIDISQTIMRDCICMTAIVESGEKSYEDIKKEMPTLSEKVGCVIRADKVDDLMKISRS